MTGGDENLDQTAEQPARDEAIPVLLRELAGRLSRVEDQVAEFHRRAAHRESVIDHLHEENQRLRGGLGRIILEPVVTDLIRLYDQLEREARRLDADGGGGLLLRSFAEEIEEILDRCGMELFSAQSGEPFQGGRHRALKVIACDDESLNNTVAEVVAVGFYERDTGRVRRPLHAHFHQYSPGRDEPGRTDGAAQSQ